MATFVSNRDSGGRTDEEGHYKFWNSTFVGHVLNGQEVVQNSPSTNMNVRVSEGILRIPYLDYAYQAWSEGYTLVPVNTADPSNPRIDRLIAYVDRSMVLDDSDINNPGMLKYKSVAGTPNAVPSKASDAAVDSSVSSSPWVELAIVRVDAGVTQILDAKITDTRLFISMSPSVSANHITPIGSVQDFAGAVAPQGWLLCYGQAVSRNAYKDLFNVIGTVYGVGDGTTTFNLPDCRGRVAAGKDNMGGTSSNRLTGLVNGIDGDVLGGTGGAQLHKHKGYNDNDSGYAAGDLRAQIGAVLGDPNRLGYVAISAINPNGGAISNYTYAPAGGSTVSNGSSWNHHTPVVGYTSEGTTIQPTIIFNKIIKT